VTTEEASPAGETPDVEPVEHAEAEGVQPWRRGPFAGRLKGLPSGKVLPAFWALLVVASAALAGGLLYFQYRPDRDTDAAVAKAAISAATDGTVAILSYSDKTLQDDFSSAKSHLTGDFLSYYNQFFQQIVAPAAKQKSLKTTAVVLRAAVSELHPDSAVVLEFVNQSTGSADRPEPTLTASSVLVTLTKADGKWLISSFDPVK
jgi:Mce-associated membrane protein